MMILNYTFGDKLHERFKALHRYIESNSPGLLAVADFADFKRRNAHLGYQVGDQDIIDFESILGALLTSEDDFLRTAGDKWAIFIKGNNTERLNSVIERFHKKDKVLVGWQGFADFNDQKLTSKTTIEAFIYRAVRCAYLLISNKSNVDEEYEKLLDVVGYCDVNELSEIPVSLSRTRWNCIDYPKEKQVCLNCGNNSFEYQGDGCGLLLEMDVKCKKCGALNSYREIFEIVT